MNSKLNHIENWPELAQKAKWSASALARRCGVSLRSLERYFLKNMGQCVKQWLTGQRHELARDLLRDGRRVKEAADQVGYQNASTFSREFRRHWGAAPRTHHSETSAAQGGNVA